MSYICPKCKHTMSVGMYISNVEGNPRCERCNTEMNTIVDNQTNTTVENNAYVKTQKSTLKVGGTLHNKNDFKSHDCDITIDKDLINEGKLSINDPEKIKSTLLEIAKTTTNVTEIGKKVMEKFFGGKS